MKNIILRSGILTIAMLFLFSFSIVAEEKIEEKDPFEIPDHVLKISKENTYTNSSEDQEEVEPSEFTKELLEDMDIPITNPDLIKMLNETSINPSPIAFGYRGMVYIGRWPLNYQSNETNVNWEYQKVNMNELNNIGGDNEQKLRYTQQAQKEVKGALTNKITNSQDIKKMMLLEAEKNTELPLGYETIIGENTKLNNEYNVPVKKYGYLHAYAPAVSEKGKVTFGEVYFQLKGSKKSLVVKNVTKQDIGAWLPIQDHVSLMFELK
ncbi:YfkD famly protein [Oceanobacillus halotolerans]|uniref:YfkD famly protein n=1 Tax=Oceanobacillus halotolerans TaxID=2663380 RepID=UPI0013D95B62|nr:YfkD famly protein [Oceanobacillus halotolerans]